MADKKDQPTKKSAAAARAEKAFNEAAETEPLLESKVDDFAEDLEGLKINYEKYFLGLDRKPPNNFRKQIEARMRELLTIQTRNTGTRFRITNLKAKLVSYQNYWDRCLQQLEDGTFHRDRFRLKLYEKKLKEKESGSAAPTKEPKVAPSPAAASRNKAIETLLGQFIEAKKQCKESTDGLTYDNFAKTLTTQTQSIKSKFQCKTVRFKVVVENGKPKLKATPV